MKKKWLYVGTEEQFVAGLKKFRELSIETRTVILRMGARRSVTIALDDFDKLIEIAEKKQEVEG